MEIELKKEEILEEHQGRELYGIIRGRIINSCLQRQQLGLRVIRLLLSILAVSVLQISLRGHFFSHIIGS